MGFMRRNQIDDFDDSEWADIDILLPREELEELEKTESPVRKTTPQISMGEKREMAKKAAKGERVSDVAEMEDKKSDKSDKVEKKPEKVKLESRSRRKESVWGDDDDFDDEIDEKKPKRFGKRRAERKQKAEELRAERKERAEKRKLEREKAEEKASALRATAKVFSRVAPSAPEVESIEDEVAELEAEVREEEGVDDEPAEIVQRKIIAAFLYGNSVLEKENVVLRASDEEMVLSGMRDGRITEKDERNLLLSIKDPVTKYGEDGVDRRLGMAEKERRILAYMTGMGFNGWEQTDGVSIKDFKKRFPLPGDFEAASQGFLKVIRSHSNEAGFAEYLKAMKNFKRQVYGLRLSYVEQLAVLKKKSAEQVKTEAGLTEISPVEARLTLGKTLISGGTWIQGALERKLTTQALARNGLAPKWKMDFEGMEIALSGAFKLATRDVIIAYVNVADKFKVRSYYRNSGQGVWRYLADYAVRENKAGKTEVWPGVGYAEEMFNLPAELQAKLSEIVSKGFIKTLDEPEFLFVGAAKNYDSVEEYLRLRKEAALEGEVYTEVAPRPTRVLVRASRIRLKPSELKVEENLKPDFKNKLFDWQMQTTLFGKVKAECFASKDGSLRWTFLEDNKHRAWISEVEVVSKVTTLGLRSEWTYSGDLTTPIYALKTVEDGYGDETETKGNYIGMWKNYVSKMQLVKEYQRSKLDRKA